MNAKLVFLAVVLLALLAYCVSGCTPEPPSTPIPFTEQIEFRRTRSSAYNSRNFDEVRDIVKAMDLANYEVRAIYKDESGNYTAVTIVGQKRK